VTLQFLLYSKLTVTQCTSALNERIQAKPTKTRHELDGHIEKGGYFSLAVTLPVFLRLKRTTRMRGRIQRESGQTIIRGYVPDGVSPQWRRIIGVVLAILGLIILFSGQLIMAVVVVIGGVLAYVPMAGDWRNADVLLIEVEKTCKASPRPPKKK
jgi:hypothetical protein